MNLGKNAFALRVQDDSMSPELKEGDVLIVDPDQSLRPGGLVVAKHQDSMEVIIRRYKQLSADHLAQEFELNPINDNWAGIRVEQSRNYQIIGIVLAFFRLM